ncbi:MAG: RNA polymerase sigma factor [Gemmatimonadales bacterium]
MGEPIHPEHPRAFPDQLRRLLDAPPGAEREMAWSRFLDEYSRLILHVARRLPCDHDVAMDRYAWALEQLQAQDCKRLRGFVADGRGKFTTWLTVVLRRLCLDHDRHRFGRSPASPGARDAATPRRPLEVTLPPELIDRIPDRTPAVDERLEQEQMKERLAEAIAALVPGDRLLLALRYQDDRSARDIAAMLRLPTPFHVYRRLNHIHEVLRRTLAASVSDQRRVAGAPPDAPAV